MKYFAIVLILLSAACKEITFREPQPKGEKPLSKVPSTLHGSYVPAEATEEVSDVLLVITEAGFKLTDPKNNELPEEILLSDSVLFTRYKDYFFLNLKNRISWRALALRQEKNKDLTHMILQEKEGNTFEEFLFSLSGQVAIDSMEYQSDMFYMIDPSSKQLIDLIEKDYFTKFQWKKVK